MVAIQTAMLRISMIVTALTGAAAGEADLSEVYPSTLEWTGQMTPLDWLVTGEDVWELESFRFAFMDRLVIELGPGRVTIGRHGSNAVWAAVVPEEPARITAVPGPPERATSIWLRFHPGRVGELFPKETVRGRLADGAAEPEVEQALIEAKRLCMHKLGGSYQVGGRPAIPPRGTIIVDLETDLQQRRFFMVDTDAPTIEYHPAFAKQGLPAAAPMSANEAAAVFDEVWAAFDEEYAMFVIKPEVDWDALRVQYRPMTERVKTNYEGASVVASMLGHLQDLHVWVRVGPEVLPVDERPRPWNSSYRGIMAMLPGITNARRDLAWARTEDGIGYVAVLSMGSADLPAAFDGALDALDDTWGLVVDLRFNGGGNEIIGQQISGRFLKEDVIYSYHQYRDGPEHEDLTAMEARVCPARGPWRYESPVIVLQGQRTFSSAESFVLMLAQGEQVTTMGDRTAGSSGNPRQLELAGGIAVNLPRWLHLKDDKTPLDGVGVEPDVWVRPAPEEFTNQDDPVLAAALQRLRLILPEKRRPGRREATAGE